ncbi:MAG: TetR family transcriptional regulator [Xanthomonadales bacterium]|jgi:TetR/AcrR family transcriptional regulator|nr:TetR family transcriptional regulator [Xanthomonadales bacterium]
MATATTARKRGSNPRGRPAGTDTADIRTAILDAAEALFAQQGYAATSVREIAEAVDVNPAMIHYYFSSKHELLQRVLERTLEPLAAAIGVMRAGGQAPAAEIAQLLLRTFSQHPSLPMLIAREVILPGGVMQEHFLRYLAPRLGGSIPGLIEKEQAAGRMHADLDPRVSTLILLSLCAFPFIARDLAGPALQITYDADGLSRLEQHIERILNEGFCT